MCSGGALIAFSRRPLVDPTPSSRRQRFEFIAWYTDYDRPPSTTPQDARQSSSISAPRSAASDEDNFQELKVYSRKASKIPWISATQQKVSPSGPDWAWRTPKMQNAFHFPKKESNCWQIWNPRQKWSGPSSDHWHGHQASTQSQGLWQSKKQEWQDSMADQSQGKVPIHSQTGKASTEFTNGSDCSWAPSCASSSRLWQTFAMKQSPGLPANISNGIG